MDDSDTDAAAGAGDRGESTQRRWNAREAQAFRVGAIFASVEVAAHYADVGRRYWVGVLLQRRRMAAAAAERRRQAAPPKRR